MIEYCCNNWCFYFNIIEQLGEERHKIVEMKWTQQKQMEESSASALSKELLVQQLEEKRELIAE